ADSFWRARLADMQPARLALADDKPSGEILSQQIPVPEGLSGDTLLAALAGFASRLAESDSCTLAFQSPDIAALTPAGYANTWVPLTLKAGDGDFDQTSATFEQALAAARENLTFACDLAVRMPDLTHLTLPDMALSEGTGAMVNGSALTFAAQKGQVSLLADAGRLQADYLDLITARLTGFLTEIARDPARALADIPILPDAERELIVTTWNQTETPLTGPALIHAAFEAQVAKTPDAVALVFEDQSLTYDALNRAANRLAHVLISQGVKPGQPVALYLPRGTDMMIGALAILKAGGAYVPLDPAFPAARLAHYLQDSGADIIVSHSSQSGALTDATNHSLFVDTDPRLTGAPDHNPDTGVGADDLAYVIYTSGSTGTPKGVMVEHGNVANFFTGMDARIDHKNGGVWLAVTSLSFDISVLELFWTLSRGFKLVLFGEDRYHTASAPDEPVHSDRHMDFSLFFWGNDDGPGPKKYQMLLDGARFADQHGFRAVWTPERHFHAFGGPYPNPAITGAAIAAVTSSIDVRSGSCVAPLHHPARIAEEWAVIDNLTNGRAGLGIAAGWQPYDFVLRPENAPPNNKAAMFDTIETLRKLWRGEEVAFPLADGTEHGVITQPRPVSKDLPIWVTTAGNPDTWREAGRVGANVLTHLLGQSIDEVGGKIEIYRDALREAGHDPADFTVTLMLHTYLADSREKAREVARGPMKDYLRSAAGLIKQFAWVFPAFKRPEGVSNAFELDLGVLNDDELEEILDFAFLRYFEDSGLFGTVEDALARTEQLKQIGVDEVACLVDYGIDSAQVLEGLKPLADVVSGANKAVALADDDFSIAAQIRRHQVSHMQMTPSMAQMVLMDDAARGALAQVKHLFIGGEALPGPMVRDLNLATPASIENMYGPTETTIWSTTGPAAPCAGTVNIGRPIANTQVYVLDANRNPSPVGVAGELYIGGLGVTRGYHNRDAMTADRFTANPFTGQGRLYRTGDRVRQRADGRLDILGRTDTQVKLRGYRIELGEIETRLAALTGAGTQAVVIAREETPGDTRLVAYVTGGKVDEKTLRDALARDLPDYMIPARIVALDSFPLTPNQKIDRKALPAPSNGASKDNVVGAFSHPKGQIERQLADIWSRILGVARIGSNDNFFDLGGHSLLAVQAHREIKAALNSDKLSITDIFRHPTLS
ncbi:MAG TPA: LLM class flavin-dependent oxidoreductase, partial [Aliiroseovarius sp.]|nr:LLM class flavin-dependent oxidoreductase [Aliiroseovarius sp.]